MMKAILEMYNDTVFENIASDKTFNYIDGKIVVKDFVPNNYYFTYYILKNYPTFRLNNKYQNLGDFVIYPKELFEIGTLTKRHYAIHYCAGEWRVNKEMKTSIKGKIKNYIAQFPELFETVQIVVRRIKYQKLNKNIPFYAYSLAQRKKKSLPEL